MENNKNAPYLLLLRTNMNNHLYKSYKEECLKYFYFKLNEKKRIEVLVSFLMYSNDLEIINIFLFQLEKIYDYNEERKVRINNVIKTIFNSYINLSNSFYFFDFISFFSFSDMNSF